MADYLCNWHLQLSSSNNTLRRITIQSLYWYGQLVWTPALGGLFVSVCVSIRGHDPTTTNDRARPQTTINDRARPRTNAYMLRFCSAHDEWFIMKLLQVCHVQYCQQCVNFLYVGYHTANNVSNFGGGPVTQLIVYVHQMKVIPQIHM